jgi:hypothetical protein
MMIVCQILTQLTNMSKLLGPCEFSSIDGWLGKHKYSRTWVSEIFHESSEIYEGLENIRLSQNSMELKLGI